MAAWIQCPACLLKHSARPDGKCPKCRFPLAALSAGAPAPGPTAPLPTTIAPSSSWGPVSPPTPARTYTPTLAPGLAATGPELSVGRLFTGTFSAWFGSAGAVLPALTFLALLTGVFVYQLVLSMGARGRSDLPMFFVMLAALLALEPPKSMLAVRAGIRHAAGRPVELGDCFSTVGRTYLATLVVIIAVLLAEGGRLLLVRVLGRVLIATLPFSYYRIVPWLPWLTWVPLCFLYTAWSVSLPAIAAEGLGPIAGMARSWVLTRGQRLRIFVAVLLIAACAGAAALGVGIAVVWLMAKVYGPSRELMPWIVVTVVVIATIASTILSTATGVAYHLLSGRTDEAELRRVFA